MKENWKKMSQIEKKYTLVVLVIFLLSVVGFSYAYFQAQIGDGTSTQAKIKTGTVDNLTFSLRDIDVSDNTKEDEHNSDGEHDYSDIVINANQDNFGPNSKSLGDGVELSAHLLANDATNKAEAQYNLFFVIEKNDFEYTTEEERPEIILEVIDPNNKPVENIVGLKKVDGGFDITKRKNATFLITSDYDIKANPKEEQKWQVKVTLVNFKDKNQNDNAGKSLSGKVYITTKDMPSYELPSVNNSSVSKTYNTITFTPTVNEGTEKVVKYYYGIEKAQTNGIALMSEETVSFEETTEPSYTFEKLQPNTKYTIYSYVENESGMRSNTYHTEVTTNEYQIPVINGVTFERGLYTIKATVNAIGRDGSITTYHYYKDGKLITSIASNEYTYEGLSDSSDYDIKIEVEDSNHVKSTAYENTVRTLEYIYPEVESVDILNQQWNSVTLTTNTKESTNPISEYKYQVEKKDGTIVQTWFVGSKTQVISNLEANQEYNVKIKVKDSNDRESKKEYVQEISTLEYKYVHIDVSPTITTNSIKLDVSATIGDGTITKYMYSKNGGSNWTEFTSTDLSHFYTFESLTSDTEFPIWVKVIDSNNKESNIYKETLTTSYIEPTSQDVVLTKIDGTNITATLNVTQGSHAFSTYYFKVNDGDSFTSSSSNTYSFEIAKTGNIKVEAYAVDSKGHTTEHVSTSYTNPSISNINVTSTYKSVTATVNVTKGDVDVESYCFKVNNTGECQNPTSIEGNTITYTFSHTPNTTQDISYNVSVYAIDKNKRESNTLNGNTTIERYEKATVDISLEKGTENSFKVVATGHKGTGEIKGYQYSSDGSSWTEVENNNKHTFENMTNTTNTLYVQVVDEYEYTNQAIITYVDPSVSLAFGTVRGESIGVTANIEPSKMNGTNQSISKYEYSNGGDSYADGSNNTYTFNVPVEESPTLYVRITDNYGRQGIGNIKYENPSIGTPTTSNPKWNSLDVRVTAKEGTAKIARYYFSSNDGTSFGSAVASTTTTGTTTLTGLEPSTEYNIRAYVEDANGRRSPNSETKTGTTADYTYPTVNIMGIDKKIDNMTVNVSAKGGTGTITSYRYFLDEDSTPKQINTKTDLTDNYKYTDLNYDQDYILKVQVVDSNGKVSVFTENVNQKITNIDTLTANISSDDFYRNEAYINKIKNVKFVNYISDDTTINKIKSWDLSTRQNNSIMGWLVDNNDTSVPYDLYIGSTQEINVKSFYWAFHNLQNLISVNFTNVNTSKNVSMQAIFSVTSLTTTNVNTLDTSNVENMSAAFFGVKISDLDLSGWDTSKVTTMYQMFSQASSLTTLDLSGWDTSKVNNMAWMFGGNGGDNPVIMKLQSIKGLESFNTSQVTMMQSMFQNCRNLTGSLNLSKWDTSKVSNMSYMFFNLNSITSIDLSGWNTPDPKGVINQIKNLPSLTTLNLSKFDVSSVTDMSYMFYKLTGPLSTLNLSNWDTSNVTAMYAMFSNSPNLTTLDLSGWDTSKVTDMAWMFGGSGGDNRVIMKLQSIKGIENFNTSQVTTMQGMFQNCQNLTTLDLSGWDTQKVTNMSNMFNLCTNLATITGIENFNTSQVTNMQNLFSYNTTITSINLKNWNTSNVTNVGWMFDGCTQLANLNLHSASFTNISEKRNMLNNVSSNIKVIVKDTAAQTFIQGALGSGKGTITIG